MGRAATGSVRFVRGKWLASLRGEYLGSCNTKQEAKDLVAATLDIDADVAPDSLRTFGEKWLDDRELGGDIRGIGPERSVWRQHVETAKFYDWPLRKVKPVDVQQWLVALSRKKSTAVTRRKRAGAWVVEKRVTDERVSRQTVLHARRLLLACFRQASVRGKVASNPVSDVSVPKMDVVSEERDEWAFMTESEVNRLFAAIEQSERREFYRAVYAVAIYGGLRKGEVLGLRWEDVRGGELHVRRSYGGPLKTRSSRRDVPMLRPVRDALDAWKRHGGAVKARGLVFAADGGGCFGKSYDAAWETQWRRKAGCRPSVRFHDLRHTCASHLVMGTWLGQPLSLREVQEWMGHSDIGTTQRYAHLAPGALRSKVQAFEQSEPDTQKRK